MTAVADDLQDLTPARVLSSVRITPESTHEVRKIVLGLETPAQYFTEGQNIGVNAPGPHPYGNATHHRYYSIAASRATAAGVELELLVRRCFYIDEISGEQYPGEASNYLCDLQPGDTLQLTGPHRSPFRIPADPSSHLLMLGTGTGIAPFRAFLRRIYEDQAGWQGRVRLYYGARTGAEMLYMNDLNQDITQYYDQKTFSVIQALSKGVLADEGDALQAGIASHADEIWRLMQDPKTHVFVAGLKKNAEALDASMAKAAGSAEAWAAHKQVLLQERRWAELTYV